MIAAAGGLLALGAAMGTRPPGARTQVGRERRPGGAPETVDPDTVTIVSESGARYFADGALVGFWRALRAHRVVEVDDDLCATIEPDWSGDFVDPKDSAAAWAERESAKGRYVLGPVLLAFDTGARRFLWSCDSDEPARDESAAFAVVLPPRAVAHIRALASSSENGG